MSIYRRFAWVRRLALVSGLFFSGMALTSCDDNSHSVYDSEALAPSFVAHGLKGDLLYDILGATVIDKGVNFAVYAEHATRVEVLIFDSKNPDTAQPSIRLPMAKDKTSGIWTLYVYGLGVGTHYGYIAFGPNWPYNSKFYPNSSEGFITDCDEEGNRYNPNKLLIDPYTRRIHKDFDWYSGGNPASGTERENSDWKSAAKSVVIKSEYQWSDNEIKWRENRMKGDAFEGHAANDLIYYEVHPKGFTAKAMDISNPGTWRGIGEKASYFADLGITAVELMPIAEKPDDGTYWGYNTIAFFAPEQRFATAIDQKKTNGVHDEFKEMVDKLHQAGIEVILDVVYNHTGEGGFWRSKVQDPQNDYGTQANFDDRTAATIYSWRGLDNKAYYHLVNDTAGKANQAYLDETGVGNQMRTNNKPFRRFILDNLRFWVEEMHVDGFRFDLASILGVDDAKVTTNGDSSSGDNPYWEANVGNTVIQDIINDERMQKYNTRFIAEPWSLSQYVNGLFPKATNKDNFAWSEWNGRFRDMIRPFVNDDNYKLSETETRSPNWDRDITIGNLLTGSSKMFQEFGDNRKPYHSVNFLTAHDGFTLYDLVTYWEKNNKCSMINTICCGDAYNAFCDTISGEDNNRSRNWCQIADCWEGGCEGDHCWEAGCNYNENKNTQGICNDAYHEALKRQMIRNYFAFLMISHGSPMILGGDEYMRTQYGNNNAYPDSADNPWNWFRWGDWISDDASNRMFDFVRTLIKIRKKYKEHLSPAEYLSEGEGKDYLWWYPNGFSSDNAWNNKSLGMYYPQKNSTPELFVMINMEAFEDRDFTLPAGEWKVLLDTQSYYDHDVFNNDPGLDKKFSRNVSLDGISTVSASYGVKPRTIVILGK